MTSTTSDYKRFNFWNQHDLWKGLSDYYRKIGVTLSEVNPSEPKEVDDFIKTWGVNTVISTIPGWKLPISSVTKRVDFIGHTPESTSLEREKYFTRELVGNLGIRLPELRTHLSTPCVVKPIVAEGQYDMTQICLTQKHLDHIVQQRDPEEYYIEEYLTDTIEVNIDFIISDGQWSILDIYQKVGEDKSKLAGDFVHWTKFASFGQLSDNDIELSRDNAETILEWASTKGGSYQGQLTGFIKDGEWYFCEINVRPGQTNSQPYFITGDEYLDAMHGSPSIITDSFKVERLILNPRSHDSNYPFHLHEKHGVSIPCGLDILDGEYRVTSRMAERSPDRMIGIVVCDRQIPQEFVDDVEKDGNFFVSH